MKQVVINSPCSEDWSVMTPNELGAFCDKCAKSVHDFTGKTSFQIHQALISSPGQEICGRVSNKQLALLNQDLERWTFRSTKSFQSGFTFALLVVFGLTLFSCEREEDKKEIEQVRKTVLAVMEKDTVAPETIIGFVEPEPVLDPIYFESVTMGGMEMPYAEPITELEEVRIETEDAYIISGAMVMIDRIDYVEPIPVELEYDENGVPYPTEFKVIAFPNPAQEQTTIDLSIPQTALFEIAMYDVNGKLIQPVYSGELKRGQFREQLDLTALQPGIYLVIINSPNFKETLRISKI